MRKRVIAANWKMNKTNAEAIDFVKNIKNKIDVDGVILATAFTSIFSISELLKNSKIKIAAQNMHFEDEGAFTGEISAKMLKDLNVEYVIIGHSERRTLFCEDDAIVNKKVLKALDENLKVILCVGESLEYREKNVANEFIAMQVKLALNGATKKDLDNIIIAYEPIWAIGTGKTASKEDANSTCKHIRDCIENLYNKEIADKIRILYGGSVKKDNAKELFEMPDIDGALVGGASLSDEFVDIVHA